MFVLLGGGSVVIVLELCKYNMGARWTPKNRRRKRANKVRLPACNRVSQGRDAKGRRLGESAGPSASCGRGRGRPCRQRRSHSRRLRCRTADPFVVVVIIVIVVASVVVRPSGDNAERRRVGL